MSEPSRAERVFDVAYATAFALEMHARLGIGKEHARRSPELLIACGHEAATVARAAVKTHSAIDGGAAFDEPAGKEA